MLTPFCTTLIFGSKEVTLSVLPPPDCIALLQSVQTSTYSCRAYNSCSAQDGEPGGPAVVELGQLEIS